MRSSQPLYAVRQAPNSIAVQVVYEATQITPVVLPEKEVPVLSIPEEAPEQVVQKPVLPSPEPKTIKPMPTQPEIVEKNLDDRMKEVEKRLLQSAGAMVQAQPVEIHNEAPLYPRIARRRGWAGVVHLKVHVLPEGITDQVLVEKSSGYPILDEAAVSAIRRWQFTPAAKGKIKFSSWIRLPVRFELTK